MSSQSGTGGAEGSLAWLWGPGVLALGYHLRALDPRLTGFVFPPGSLEMGDSSGLQKSGTEQGGDVVMGPRRPRAIALSQLLCRAFL